MNKALALKLCHRMLQASQREKPDSCHHVPEEIFARESLRPSQEFRKGMFFVACEGPVTSEDEPF
ncbi:hypothetical protein [Arthrobacter sp. OAP107]|uniref:hypothetical protein n=1 Tax=Arthrobacter sp. OAP107 TaxID=3156445 RepID=UPI0033907FDC